MKGNPSNGYLSEGSVVLDFFVGSGTTGRVCVEEGRHSIMVDSDEKLMPYFHSYMQQVEQVENIKPFEIVINKDLRIVLNQMINNKC